MSSDLDPQGIFGRTAPIVAPHRRWGRPETEVVRRLEGGIAGPILAERFVRSGDRTLLVPSIRRSAEKGQTISDEILMNPRKKGTSPFSSRRNPGPFNLEGTGKGGCPLFSKSPALDRIRPRAGRNNSGDVLLDVAELGVRAAGASQAFRIRRRIPRPAIPRPAAARAIVEGSGTTAAVPGEPMLVTVKGAGTGVTD